MSKSERRCHGSECAGRRETRRFIWRGCRNQGIGQIAGLAVEFAEICSRIGSMTDLSKIGTSEGGITNPARICSKHDHVANPVEISGKVDSAKNFT